MIQWARITGALLESPDEVFLLGMNIFEKFNMFWRGETKTATIDFLPLTARRVEFTRAIRDRDGRIVGSVREWVPPDQLHVALLPR